MKKDMLHCIACGSLDAVLFREVTLVHKRHVRPTHVSYLFSRDWTCFARFARQRALLVAALKKGSQAEEPHDEWWIEKQ